VIGALIVAAFIACWAVSMIVYRYSRFQSADVEAGQA
jgi:hypothetical protein